MEMNNPIPDEHSALYQQIGRFIVSFEMILEQARTLMIFHIVGNNDSTAIRILFADKTAEPIFKALRAFIYHRIGPSKERENKVLGKLINACVSMCQIRNEFVHGSWFISFKAVDPSDLGISDPDPGAQYYVPSAEIDFKKPKNTAKGFNDHLALLTVESLSLYADTCEQLALLVSELTQMITGSIDLSSFEERVKKLPELKSLIPERGY